MGVDCRSTHIAVVHPHNLMKHPWRTSDTVLVVHDGCFNNWCGCTTATWVLRHPHFHIILHLWLLESHSFTRSLITLVPALSAARSSALCRPFQRSPTRSSATRSSAPSHPFQRSLLPVPALSTTRSSVTRSCGACSLPQLTAASAASAAAAAAAAARLPL